jgi:hypothetical protein
LWFRLERIICQYFVGIIEGKQGGGTSLLPDFFAFFFVSGCAFPELEALEVFFGAMVKHDYYDSVAYTRKVLPSMIFSSYHSYQQKKEKKFLIEKEQALSDGRR